MKRALILAATVISADSASLRSGSTSSASFARSWLQHHDAPSTDELSELKAADPESYALVTALLKKRSLGLLDPMHALSSSKSSAAPPVEDSVSGSIESDVVTEKMPTAPASSDFHESAPAPVFAPRAHAAGLDWRPRSEASDEAMVASVLGEVASLKGVRMTSGRTEVQSTEETMQTNQSPEPLPSVSESVSVDDKGKKKGSLFSYLLGGDSKPVTSEKMPTAPAAIAPRAQNSADFHESAPAPVFAPRASAMSLSWRPRSSEASDEAMVASVLGEVASLKGVRMTSEKTEVKSALAADEQSLEGLELKPSDAETDTTPATPAAVKSSDADAEATPVTPAAVVSTIQPIQASQEDADTRTKVQPKQKNKDVLGAWLR